MTGDTVVAVLRHREAKMATLTEAAVLAVLRDLPRRAREQEREWNGMSSQEPTPRHVALGQADFDEQWARQILAEMRTNETP